MGSQSQTQLSHQSQHTAQVSFVGKVEVKVTQSCLTLCDPMDCIVHGILQARILKWVAFALYRGLPNSGIELRSPELRADSLPAEPTLVDLQPNWTFV